MSWFEKQWLPPNLDPTLTFFHFSSSPRIKAYLAPDLPASNCLQMNFLWGYETEKACLNDWQLMRFQFFWPNHKSRIGQGPRHRKEVPIFQDNHSGSYLQLQIRPREDRYCLIVFWLIHHIVRLQLGSSFSWGFERFIYKPSVVS